MGLCVMTIKVELMEMTVMVGRDANGSDSVQFIIAIKLTSALTQFVSREELQHPIASCQLGLAEVCPNSVWNVLSKSKLDPNKISAYKLHHH